MKFFGNVTHDNDVTNKKYVDELHKELDESKLEESDMVEFTNTEIETLWNDIFSN